MWNDLFSTNAVNDCCTIVQTFATACMAHSVSSSCSNCFLFRVHSHSGLKPRPGEVVIDRLEQVEDTKGNNGEKGAGRVLATHVQE